MRTSIEALRESPIRTGLSALGVIIGVASLVAVLSLGDGITTLLREDQASLDDGRVVTVTPRTLQRVDYIPLPLEAPARLDLNHLEAIQVRLAGRASAALAKQAGVPFSLGSASEQRALYLVANTPEWMESRGWKAISGRTLTWDDLAHQRNVALLSVRALPLWGLGSPQTALAEEITLEGRSFEIVGVVDDGGLLSGGFMFVPFTLESLGGLDDALPTLAVRTEDPDMVPQVARDLDLWFADAFPSSPVTIRRPDQSFENTLQQVRAVKLSIGAIIGIAILVGGIGIMNVMLSSVIERTREIGIRRAVGARRRDILVQFLAESVIVSAAGSLIGLILGLGIAAGGAALIRLATEVPVGTHITLGTLSVVAAVAIVVGVGSGLYPAARAAELSPVDAMRHE